jgi:hypothetical protein
MEDEQQEKLIKSAHAPLVYAIIVPRQYGIYPDGLIWINGMFAWLWSAKFPITFSAIPLIIELGNLKAPVTVSIQLYDPDLELVASYQHQVTSYDFGHSVNLLASLDSVTLKKAGIYSIQVLYLNSQGYLEMIGFRPLPVYAQPSPGVYLLQVTPDEEDENGPDE